MLPNNKFFNSPLEKWPTDWLKLLNELRPIESTDNNFWRKLVNSHLSSIVLKDNTEAGYKKFYQNFWVNVLPKIKKNPHGLNLAALEGYDIYIQKWLSRLSDKEKDVLVNAKAPSGDTALHRACDNNHPATVKVLLENKAKPNVRGLLGETPLHRAAFRNEIEIINLLLQNGALVDIQRDDDEQPIHLAASNGAIEAIERLIRQDPSQLNTIGHEGKTPLYAAAITGRTEAMRTLLKLGANPNQINAHTGNGVLHVAAIKNNPEIVTALTEFKADMNLLDRTGLTPLSLCELQSHHSVETAQALMRNGAKAEAVKRP